MSKTATQLDRVAAALRDAKRVLFITGAGMSADSGLPTYRGVGGLYEGQLTGEGMPIEEVLSGPMFQRDPALTWRYLRQIEEACRDASHNRGHEIIAAFEKALPEVWTLTQNVDGFHRSAGSRNVIEVHGTLHDLVCTHCGRRESVENFAQLEPVPMCRHCMGLQRPRVVLFGENLPHHEMLQLEEQLSRGFDLVFTIGTTSVFPYIALPVVEASRRGIPTVEINPGTSEVSPLVTYRFESRAADTLDALWRRFAHG